MFEFGEEIGKTVETIVADHASRLLYKLEGRMQSYYRKGKKGVDIVIKTGPTPLPTKVKYQEHPDDIGGVKEFMNEFYTGVGIVVTKNTLRLDGDVLFVPLPLFLVVC